MNESSVGAARALGAARTVRSKTRHAVRTIIMILRERSDVEGVVEAPSGARVLDGHLRVRHGHCHFGLTGRRRDCYEAKAPRNGVLQCGTVARWTRWRACFGRSTTPSLYSSPSASSARRSESPS